MSERIVRSEFHSYHVTRETDQGVLASGAWEGERFVTTVIGCGDSWEAAERDLERGGSMVGYRTEHASVLENAGTAS